MNKKLIDPVCVSCIRAYGFPLRVCLSFPNGIPDDIWEGRNDHSRPYLGDNGILYKSKWEE